MKKLTADGAVVEGIQIDQKPPQPKLWGLLVLTDFLLSEFKLTLML